MSETQFDFVGLSEYEVECLASGHVPMTLVTRARFALDFDPVYLASNAAKPIRRSKSAKQPDTQS